MSISPCVMTCQSFVAIVRSSLGRTRGFNGEFGQRECRRAKATLLQQEDRDLMRMAMVRLDRICRRRCMKARIVRMIHDDLWEECSNDEETDGRCLM